MSFVYVAFYERFESVCFINIIANLSHTLQTTPNCKLVTAVVIWLVVYLPSEKMRQFGTLG